MVRALGSPAEKRSEGITHHPLNAICPYYTMFPMAFPLRHLGGLPKGTWVLDPFCGRGTTAFAARTLGLNSVGVDVSPVAVAIGKAKVADCKPSAIVALAERILAKRRADAVPAEDEFWERAFHPETLHQLLKLRAHLRERQGVVNDALRGVILGALHGPQGVAKDSYFSNQMQRTFAPKPDYAIRFWRKGKFRPRNVDVLQLISERAERYYSEPVPKTNARVVLGDSRNLPIRKVRFAITVTSPPYFGMNTYVPDQWLRHWFLGGPPRPEYGYKDQLAHGTPLQFAVALGKVWRSIATRSSDGAKLVIRFGSLPSRDRDPEMIIRHSIGASGAPWKILRITDAGDAAKGRRQGLQMGATVRKSVAVEEIDVICRLG